MAIYFRPGATGQIQFTFDEHSSRVLLQLISELLVLLDAEQVAEPVDQTDPLSVLHTLGMDLETGVDPALDRFFPDAYQDDPEAAADFRRYTLGEIRVTKINNALAVREILSEEAGTYLLTATQVEAFIATLNDLRLALGARLELRTDADAVLVDNIQPDDAMYDVAIIYQVLGALQENLLTCVMGKSTGS